MQVSVLPHARAAAVTLSCWCQLSQCHDRLCLANPALEWGEGVSPLPTPGEQLLPGH